MQFMKKIFLFLILFPILSQAQRIEIPYYDHGGWMLVKLRIDGEQRNFIFDTGWDGLAIRKSLLNEYKTTTSVNAVDANNVTQEVQMLKVKSMSVGDYTFYNLHFTNLEDFPMLNDPIFDCYQIDGILGNLIYRDRVMQIDPERKKIILQDPSLELLADLEQQGFTAINNANTTNQNRIVLPMEVAGSTREFLWDTGDTGYISIGVDNQIISYLPQVNFNKYLGVGSVGAFGMDSKITQSFIAPDLDVQIAGLNLKNQEVSFLANNFVSQVGVEFVKQFHLVYFPSMNKIFLKNRQNPPKVISTLEKVGFGIAFYKGYYTIAAIGEHNKDFELGDIVLAIDQVPIGQMCDYRMYLRTSTHRPAITIFREGEELTI